MAQDNSIYKITDGSYYIFGNTWGNGQFGLVYSDDNTRVRIVSSQNKINPIDWQIITNIKDDIGGFYLNREDLETRGLPGFVSAGSSTLGSSTAADTSVEPVGNLTAENVQAALVDHQNDIDIIKAGSASAFTNLIPYNTVAEIPTVSGLETDRYCVVLQDPDLNNRGLYTIIGGAWKLLYHMLDFNIAPIIKESIQEINLNVPVNYSTVDATEDGVIVGYRLNIGSFGVVASSSYYITDFMPIAELGSVNVSSNQPYWLFDKDKQPLPDEEVDYNNSPLGKATMESKYKLGYIRYSLPLSTIGVSEMAAQQYNVYGNNPGSVNPTGWEDYHGRAMAKITFEGSGGSVDGILANGVEILSGAEAFNTDLRTTIANVAANINDGTGTHGYIANALNGLLLVWNNTIGATANGDTIVSSTTTLTSTDVDFNGGIDNNYKRDNEKFVYEDEGVIWKKYTNDLFNKRNVMAIGSYTSSGGFSGSFASTGFIKCQGNKAYTINLGANTTWTFWTADQQFISGTIGWAGIVTPANCRNISVAFSRTIDYGAISITASNYIQDIFYKNAGMSLIEENFPINTSVCLIGDSIGTESGIYAKKSGYGSLMADTLGIENFFNVSVSGKTAINFASNINTGTQDMPFADHYIIALGTNDHGYNQPVGSLVDTAGTSSYTAALKQIVVSCRAINPNAGFAIIAPPKRHHIHSSEYNAVSFRWLREFSEAAIAFALENNFLCVNMYRNGLNPRRLNIANYFYVDDIDDTCHPTDEGHASFFYPKATPLIKKLVR